MLTTRDTQIIAGACDTFKVARPKYVVDAQKLVDAAGTLVADTAAETVPDLGTLSLENMRAIHAQMSTISTKPERLGAAVKIQSQAQQALLIAWMRASSGLLEAFRAPFDKAVGRFTQALTDLGGDLDASRAVASGRHKEHAALTQAAADLGDLARVRDALALASTLDVGHPVLEREGRILTFPNGDSVINTLSSRTQGAGRYEAPWFAAVLGIPGVRIEWHTPAEQQTWLELAKSKTAA